MRKFLVASVLALPVLALTQAPASAWCKFGCSLNFSSGGHKFCCDSGNPPCDPCCCAPCCPAPYYAAPLPPPPPPPHASAPAPVAPVQAIQSVDYQTLSNYYWQAAQQNAYYNYYQAAYGAGQVPSYWYGN